MDISLEASDSLELRQASQDDNEFAYQVKKAAFREYVEQVWGWDEDEQRRFHYRRLQAQDFYVISLDGIDAGIMSLALEPDCVYANQLYVLPEHQGQGLAGGACCWSWMRRASSACRYGLGC